MHTRHVLAAFTLVAAAALPSPAAEPADLKALESAYSDEVQPLIVRYCHECHAGERIEAEVDFSALASWKELRKHPRTWQKAAEMLTSGQMPPPDAAAQPSDDERARLRDWVKAYLTAEAAAHAGDPGRVVLRRLSNAEYTYTLRDLTGVESLDPAREFPVDGAAGEGFTNTGGALVMSPALFSKYLDAAKEVAGHAVLLPDGFRFSPSSTRRDWTDENLARIRAFYAQFSAQSGGEQVNLQGIVFNTNEGGRLPLEKYLAATIIERVAISSGKKSIEQVAREQGLNAKYLGLLWKALTSDEPSPLLASPRARWRTAMPDDVAALVGEIAAWQKELWRFTTVGQIGKVGGPTRWMEPITPVAAQQEVRFKFAPAGDGGDVVISLVASDAGDGNEQDFVVWQQPRLVAPGRPDLLLKDVRGVVQQLSARRADILADTSKYLAAAHAAAEAKGSADAAKLAASHGVDLAALRAWLDYLGIGSGGEVEVKGHFTTQLTSASGYDFIQGWGSHETPLLVANSSDSHVRIPGNMQPHGVAVHPSPSLRAAVGWRSPVTANVRIAGVVTHAHPECGNGVVWLLELRRGATRKRLAEGIAHGAKEVAIGPIESLGVQRGDLVSLLIAPRDGNHSCDLTAVDLTITGEADGEKTWNLAKDVSPDVLAGNPHADRLGNKDVWHFYSEPEQGAAAAGAVIPADSLLAKWQAAASKDEKQQLADELQKLLTGGAPADANSPDALLHRQLHAFGGPLLGELLTGRDGQDLPDESDDGGEYGLDPALFGKHPSGGSIDSAGLCVQAPAVLEIRLPADLVAGCELVATAAFDAESAAEGSVQVQVVAGKPDPPAGIFRGAPVLVGEASHAQKSMAAAFSEFRKLFPPALCYTKIVPVDEVITLQLFYREDDHLARLMLDAEQAAGLDRMWDELRYVSQDALTLVDAFEQLLEYASQDADPKVFEPMRKSIYDAAAAYRQRLIDDEPRQLDALIAFASRAYRRPLAEAEERELRGLYARLRQQELPHEDAFCLTLAKILVAPAFLYKLEQPVAGDGQGPVNDWELASRLSYFLWSSQPDDELKRLAAAGRLHESQVLWEQAQRMLKDDRSRRLATEFACQWLHIYNFDQLDEKSERHFPTFAALRGAMYEESIQFFTDLFQRDGTVLEILEADHTFLNEDLAKHYGVPGVSGPEWRRVEGMKQFSRGGVLAQATTLSVQSGASRTSPVLRGNWISEVLLGERLPRPPKGVPQLPDDEAATEGLTVRQLVEKHASDVKCAVCHRRIDPLGFSLERFDAIGRLREKDLGDRPIDTHAKTIDGAEFEGLNGLQNYLLTQRRAAFVRQFCKKLLGYALGREVQLSDEPLLAEMQAELEANEYHVSAAFKAVVLSRQFREIRGIDVAEEE